MNDLILSPDKFFKEIVTKPMNLKLPLIIVLLWSLVSSVVILTPIIYLEGVEDVMLLILKFIILFIATFLSNVVILLIIAGFSYIILIKLFNGIGDFKKMLEIIGYVSFVYLIEMTVALIIQIVSILTNTVYADGDYIIKLMDIVVTLWAMLLFAKGIQYNYKLTFKKSLVIPFLIFLLNFLSNMTDYINIY
ncbi:Protein of unknown function DUF2143 [Methanocaldococcus vulcanius M7]|uniref:Yip1 domain-containing protein n=1 Tax=Methanocaldococcus vulcanius (strain ATCC 700851 / DSM 12094 / M7) TaxID=579137 RepID=C9RF33_METVM|nr:YIP1 family protein [Methanocaldococcus vulcanius]ACX72185.1 Protein of unknown function DUF2143 [Methanocaldococcus vulcanius M7]